MATGKPPTCWRWHERYDSLLSTILIGNNIVNIGASSLATVLFTRLVGGVPTALRSPPLS